MKPDDDDDTTFSIAMAGVKLYLGNSIFKQSFNVSPITGRQRLDYQSHQRFYADCFHLRSVLI